VGGGEAEAAESLAVQRERRRAASASANDGACLAAFQGCGVQVGSQPRPAGGRASTVRRPMTRAISCASASPSGWT